MAKVLSSISLDAPTSQVTAEVNDTFAFSGTPTFSGGGGVQRYDFKWEVNAGGGYVTIGASNTGLITSGTNPITNSNSQTQNSITVTCEQAGSYTIRMAGAPSTGGSYTVFSPTQTAEVSEVAGTDELSASGITTGAPTAGAPAITQAHVLTASGATAGAVQMGAPSLGQVHAMTPSGITTSAATVGAPALSENAEADDLEANGIATGAPVLGSPAIAQIHALIGIDLAADSPSMGGPELYSGTEEQSTPECAPCRGSQFWLQGKQRTDDDVRRARARFGIPQQRMRSR